jgi:hypothetical protein
LFKIINQVQPDTLKWREPGYEYDFERLPIDLLNGGTDLREWVENPKSTIADLEARMSPDEQSWRQERKPHLLYPDA